MSFEEWYKSTYKHTAFLDENGEIAISPEMRKCWNAAIDECVKVANRKRRGITPECIGYNDCSTEIMEKMKELKE